MKQNKINLPELWKLKKLGDVCDFQNGFAFKSQLFRENGIPVIRITNIQDQSIDLNKIVYVNLEDYKQDLSIYRVQQGDLLIAMSGATTGKIGVVDNGQEFLLNQRVGKFIPKKILNKKYLYYYLLTQEKESLKISAGSAQPNLSTQQIKSFKIPVPPIEEQKRIVEILDKAFEGIAQAEANTRRNLINARELFDSYLNKIFTEKSGNWKVATIQDHIKFIDYRGRTPSKTSKGMRLITAKNIKKGFLQSEPQEFVDPEIYDSWMIRGIPKKGDILFTTEAPLGNVAQLDTDKKVVFAQRVIIMQPDENYINCTFLKYLLLAQPIQQRIHKQATGATAQGIKASLLKKIVIEFPEDINCQKELILKIEKIEQQAKKLETIYQRKLEAIAELKQSILEKAFTGQLSQ
jgi:type I restriction enzyme S subunit